MTVIQSETLSILGQALHICFRGKNSVSLSLGQLQTVLPWMSLNCIASVLTDLWWPQHFSAVSMTGRIQSLLFMSLCFFPFQCLLNASIWLRCLVHMSLTSCKSLAWRTEVFGEIIPQSVCSWKKKKLCKQLGKKNLFFYFAVIQKYGIRPANSVHNLLVIFHWIICSIILINKKFAVVKQKM